MENKDTFTTNEMYKMFAIVGLLMLLGGFIDFIGIYTKAYKQINRDKVELAGMSAALAQPHSAELEQRRGQLQRSIMVAESERDIKLKRALPVLLFGAGALALGFRDLPSRIKPDTKASEANYLHVPSPQPAPAPPSEPEPLPSIQELAADPSTSTWLLETLTSALKRDPVDAAIDAEMLQKVLTARMNAIFNESRRTQDKSTRP